MDEEDCLKYKNGITQGSNKKGEMIDCCDEFKIDCQRIADISNIQEFLLDGEEIGTTFYVFDILSSNGTYSERWLKNFLIETTHIKPVYTVYSEIEKRQFFNSLKLNNKEGVVFKLLSGKHINGYSDEQVKFKFYSTASVIVMKHNVKDSIGIGIWNNNKIEPIGNVTMIGHVKPPIGTVIEVKYLYVVERLYQPSFIGIRDDVDIKDCTRNKLKFKRV